MRTSLASTARPKHPSLFPSRTLLEELETRVLLTAYSLLPNPAVVAESAGVLTFSVVRTGGLIPETVFASTVSGSANGFDANNGDYTNLVDFPVVFAANQNTASVPVFIFNDSLAENNEVFGLVVQRTTFDPVSVFLAKDSFTIVDSGAGSAPPTGFLDIVTRHSIAGWAFDPNARATSVNARIDIDGVAGVPFLADDPRPDLVNFAPVGSPNHGFDLPTPALSPAAHNVSLFVQDFPGSKFVKIQSGVIPPINPTVPPGLPFGTIDIATQQRVAGWAFDPNAGANSILAELHIDGQAQTPFTADLFRSDLAITPGIGSPNHGFDITMPTLSFGVHTIDLFAENFPNTNMVKISTRTVSLTIPGSPPPLGWIDQATHQSITGWGFDKDAGTIPVFIRVDIDGVAGTTIIANAPRPDLTNYAPVGSPNHGFTLTFTLPLAAGTHTIALLVQDYPGNNFVRVFSGIIPATP